MAVTTERVLVEGICLSPVVLLALALANFMELAPLTTSLKSASPKMQKLAFVGIAFSMYLAARAYFHLALLTCDTVATKLNIREADSETEAVEGVEGAEAAEESEQTSRNSSTKSSAETWLWRFSYFLFATTGLAVVFHFVPGAASIVDESISRFLGDVPQVIISSIQKDSVRFGTRGKRILGLCFAYFAILFVLELLLRVVLFLLGALYRKLSGSSKAEPSLVQDELAKPESPVSPESETRTNDIAAAAPTEDQRSESPVEGKD
jgi:hypothetical protein